MTFERVFAELPSQGWLAEDEARLLWDIVLSSGGDVLEIGTYHGRSAFLAASALKQRESKTLVSRRLFCCDPFLEHFDGVQTASQSEIVLSAAGSLCRGPLARFVSLCWQTEETLRQTWPELNGLGIVYIDGDHSYEGTLGALDRWAPLASLIAMHDYGMCKSFDGVQKAAADYGLGAPIKRAGSMAIFNSPGKQ